MKNATTCPICKRAVPLELASAGAVPFPFCSARCKLVDLGAWLDGAYRIPGEHLLDEASEGAGGLRLTSNDGGDA